MTAQLRPGERVDDLQAAGYRIIQRADRFRFGTDSVLLAHFARVQGAARVADLGAGTGALSLLMAARATQARFDLIEVQSDIADMAERSIRLNGLQNRMSVHALDMRQAHEALGCCGFDAAVLNPPYGRAGGTYQSADPALCIARHEVLGGFPDYARAMGQLLRNGGCAYVVHLAGRMLDVLDALRDARLQPKKIRFVHQSAGGVPTHLLVEARKGVRPGFSWLPPIIVSENGRPSDQLRRIYQGEDA